MPWSTSGTWTNEASKTVTAVASTTGGITVTAASHGYSNGDFVQLIDLGTYNGAYFISNVTTNTFDIVNQYKQDGTLLSYGATDSGTCAKGAKDFSGITGVTNVSQVVNNSKDKIYQSSGTSVEITIKGAICIDPKFETVILNRSAGAGKNALTVDTGGILQIGIPDLENSYYDFPAGVAFIFPVYSTNNSFAYQETWSPFRCIGSGELKWFSGTVFCYGAVAWYGKVLCMSKNCILSSRNTVAPQIRQRSSNCIIKGLTTHDYKFTAIVNASEIKGYVPIQSTSAIDMSSSGSNNTWYTFYNLIAGYGNDKEVGIKNKMWVRLVNVNNGSDITIHAQTTGSTNQAGICEIREELSLTIQEQDGTKIENCRVFIRDTDHSHRLAANTYNSNPDYEDDRTYGGLTDTDGEISFTGDTGSILLTCYHRPDNGATTNDVWDSRGKNNNKTDLFDVGFACYGYIAGVQEYELKGNDGIDVTYVLFADTGIVESNKTTVSGYTSIDNLSKLYDYAQYWVQKSSDNMEEIGLGSMVVEKSGKTIDFGAKHVYLDSSYSDVFDYTDSSKNVQVKIGSGLAVTTAYTGIKATTFYLNDAINLTDITLDGDLHINTGANSTLTFSNVTVTGNIYNDDTSHTLTITASNGASITAGDAGTGNGQTNIQHPVTVKVTVKDAATGAAISGAMVFLEESVSGTDIIKTTTNASGVAQNTTYDYTTDKAVTGRVRKASSGSLYKTGDITGTITSNGFDTTILLIKDE